MIVMVRVILRVIKMINVDSGCLWAAITGNNQSDNETDGESDFESDKNDDG